MNKLFYELTNSLSKEFKNYNLNESVQLSMSKLPEYDMQINNLVKYNKSDFFEELKKNIIKIINSSNLFKVVEENNIGSQVTDVLYQDLEYENIFTTVRKQQKTILFL